VFVVALAHEREASLGEHAAARRPLERVMGDDALRCSERPERALPLGTEAQKRQP
jgi:hypothetical protein